MPSSALDHIQSQAPTDQLHTLAEGLSPVVASEVAEEVGMSVESLATALGLSPRTLRSRPGSVLNETQGERLYRVHRAFVEALRVFNSVDAARRFLTSEHRAFRGERPIDLLRVDVGFDEVRRVLGAIYEGSYL